MKVVLLKVQSSPPVGGLEAISGFTLVELIVVVGITLTLASVVAFYSSTARSNTALYIEKAKIGQFLLKAKALTLQTRLRADKKTRPCGYGVRVDSLAGTLELFNYAFPQISSCPNIRKGKPSPDNIQSEINETITLNSDVRFQAKDASQRLEIIFFLAPDPATLLWLESEGGAANQGASNGGKIYIEAIHGDAKAEIMVTPAGEVSFF